LTFCREAEVEAPAYLNLTDINETEPPVMRKMQSGDFHIGQAEFFYYCAANNDLATMKRIASSGSSIGTKIDFKPFIELFSR